MSFVCRSTILIAVAAAVVAGGCGDSPSPQDRYMDARMNELGILYRQQNLLEWFYLTEGQPLTWAETYSTADTLLRDSTAALAVTRARATGNPLDGAFADALWITRAERQTADLEDSLRAILPLRQRLRPAWRYSEAFDPAVAASGETFFRVHAAAFARGAALQDSAQVRRRHFAGDADFARRTIIALGLAETDLDSILDSLWTASGTLLADRLAGTGVVDLTGLLRLLESGNLAALAGSDVGAAPERCADLFEGLGILVERQSRLTLDWGLRAGKRSECAALPVDAPRDVRLTAVPEAGFATWSRYFHEMGLAQQALYITAKEPLWRQGPRTIVQEGFAALLEGLAATGAAPDDLGRREVLAEAARLRDRVDLRLALMTIRHDRNWFAGAGMPNPDAAAYGEALGLTVSEAERNWLVAHRPPLRQALTRVMGTVLASRIAAGLVDRYGPEWHRSIAAGRELKLRWSEGRALGMAALRERIGE